MKLARIGNAAVAVLLASNAPAAMAEATFSTKGLTVETALKAAQAALEACRKGGYQVGVAVGDRSGVLQVYLRDRFAGAHTVDAAGSTLAGIGVSGAPTGAADEACARAGIDAIRADIEF